MPVQEDLPSSPSQVPPVLADPAPESLYQSPQMQEARRSSRMFNNIAAILTIVVVGVVSMVGIVKLTTKPQAPLVTTTATTDVTVPELQASYANPFDKQTQYQNPFSENQNPFDNLSQ